MGAGKKKKAKKEGKKGREERPVLEGPSKLVGVDGKLETKVVRVVIHVRENLHHWVLPEHVPSLEQKIEHIDRTIELYTVTHTISNPNSYRFSFSLYYH